MTFLLKDFLLLLSLITLFLTYSCSSSSLSFYTESSPSREYVVANYTQLVHANYLDAQQDAVELKEAILALLKKPNHKTLEQARAAWFVARDSYSQTEAFRFYEGPIDFVDSSKGTEGPEAQLNAWPVNEAYIDYVAGNALAGIVQDTTVKISKKTLLQKNQEHDEADVSTGYHAIEFLLWGQDLSLTNAGNRPPSDFTNTSHNARRRAYLKIVTDILLNDLNFLVKSWSPNRDNYARSFRTDPEAISKIMQSLITLTGFELAAERLGTALDSNDQEDEQSCFSDNTHQDFIANMRGVSNVFFGRYAHIQGSSIYQLLKLQDAALADAIAQKIQDTQLLFQSLPFPFDQKVLAAPPGSDARKQAEAIVISLQELADLLKEASPLIA